MSALAGAAVINGPVQPDGIASISIGTESVLIAILAVIGAVLAVSTGILYRKMHRREEELRERVENGEAELRALLMMTDEAVLVMSRDGTIRAANPAAEELFGRASDEFAGSALTEFMAQPLALGELTKHGPVNFEASAKLGTGETVQVEMLLAPVELAAGKGFLALIHGSHATLRYDNGKKVNGKEGMHTAIEKFTHDLNNQLTSVLGNLSLILMARPGDPATHERILAAKNTAYRAQAISQKLQGIAAGSPEADAALARPHEATDMKCTILPMPQSVQPAPVPAPKGPTRILILDDDPAICALLESVLDASGFEVQPVTTVEDATRACDEAVRGGNPFSLVICDLCLSGNMDGIAALKKLRAIDSNIKAIVSSGYDGDPAMVESGRHGFNASIAKPYDVSKLIRAVGEVLAGGKSISRKSA